MRALGLVVLVSCAGNPTQRAPTIAPMPDFALSDVNPASPTSGQLVKPSALRGKVSGWYFTHSG